MCTGIRIVRERSGNALANPPRGIRAEFEPATIVKPLCGLHQTDIAFLHQIQEAEAPTIVMLGKIHDEAQVGQHHFGLRLFQVIPPGVELFQDHP